MARLLAGRTADVAQAVASLLGGDFVTGQVVQVDGERQLLEAAP